MKSRFHYRIRNSRIHYLSELGVSTLHPSNLLLSDIFCSHYSVRFIVWPLSDLSVVYILSCPTRFKRFTYLIFLDLIILVIFGKECIS